MATNPDVLAGLIAVQVWQAVGLDCPMDIPLQEVAAAMARNHAHQPTSGFVMQVFHEAYHRAQARWQGP